MRVELNPLLTDEVNDALPNRRLSTRQPDLCDPTLDEKGGKSNNLVVAQYVRPWRELYAFLRHAVKTSQVAAFGQ